MKVCVHEFQVSFHTVQFYIELIYQPHISLQKPKIIVKAGNGALDAQKAHLHVQDTVASIGDSPKHVDESFMAVCPITRTAFRLPSLGRLC
jgi:hypothetical protein